MIKTKTDIGKWGEEQAVIFLIKRGYGIIERNYRTKHGEVDIIASFMENNSRVISFIEVKTRKKDDGTAERATNYQKINRFKYSASVYCRKNNIEIQSAAILFEHISICVAGKKTIKIKKYILPLDC